MKRADNIMTRDQRQQFADRIEVLEKVKGLLMVPQLCMATTEQVAEYFDVPVETIRSTFNRNKAELEANGVVLITPAGLDSFALQNATQVAARGYRLFSVDDVVFSVPNSGCRFYPPRAVLCLGMMLKESAVAAEIRTQLLNLVEAAPMEMKVANIQSQETAMLQFARAMMDGDATSIAQSVKQLMALKDHTIAAQAAQINQLNSARDQLESEKRQLEADAENLRDHNKSLSGQNADLTRLNQSLVMSNRMMAEETIIWEPRAVANAIIRDIGGRIFNKKYGLAWNEFYRELKYKTGISVGQRGNGTKNESALSTIHDDEWPKVMKVLAAMGVRYCIDVVAVTNQLTVDHYGLDRYEDEDGIRFNTGIARTICA